MLPGLNVLAGVAIGFANNNWVTVLGAAAGWPVFFCVYVWVFDSKRANITIAKKRTESPRPFFSRHPVSGFYLIEALSSLLTVLPVAAIVFTLQ